LFGSGLKLDFPVMNELISRGYAEESNGYIKLTPIGVSLSDCIGPMFISDEVKMKMRAKWPVII
jgi:oxygen-independent coproporphyrinogen-3 oxidase